MGKLIFITGATRSGKSRLAVDMAKRIGGANVAFIATCIPRDTEMKKRICQHRKNRPASWKVIEADKDLAKALKNVKSNCEAVIIDCLTLFVSNLIMNGARDDQIRKKLKNSIKFMSKAPYACVVVSSEVGGGVVPENKLARRFRDQAGIANQIAARHANEVFFVVSGIPMKIK